MEPKDQNTANDARSGMRTRRSALYIPASNRRALAKACHLGCDTVIFDLEDAVGPREKEAARAALAEWFAGPRPAGEFVVRVNASDTDWGAADIREACRWRPDALLLPKVNDAGDIARAAAAIERHADSETVRLWAMIETPAAVANALAIAATAREPGARLDCLVAGTNDLAKDTGVALLPGRPHLGVWLMQLVLAARTGGIDVLDGVYNDFRDLAGFERECEQGVSMGFDGKTLIHPTQIDAANRVFGVSDKQLEEARDIVAAFARPENHGLGVLQIDGRMVERLHLHQAEKLIAKATYQQDNDRGEPS